MEKNTNTKKFESTGLLVTIALAQPFVLFNLIVYGTLAILEDFFVLFQTDIFLSNDLSIFLRNFVVFSFAPYMPYDALAVSFLVGFCLQLLLSLSQDHSVDILQTVVQKEATVSGFNP